MKSLIAGGVGLFMMNSTTRVSDEEQSKSSIGKADGVDYSNCKFADGNIIVPDAPGFGPSLEY
jgi:hypothetical protein